MLSALHLKDGMLTDFKGLSLDWPLLSLLQKHTQSWSWDSVCAVVGKSLFHLQQYWSLSIPSSILPSCLPSFSTPLPPSCSSPLPSFFPILGVKPRPCQASTLQLYYNLSLLFVFLLDQLSLCGCGWLWTAVSLAKNSTCLPPSLSLLSWITSLCHQACLSFHFIISNS